MTNFISKERLRESSSVYPSTEAAVESDRSRVLFSAPFRRLQEKAQVFSLEDNAAVRSRLTHSIEVSHIGRYLTRTVIEKYPDLLPKIGIKDKKDEAAAITIVETSCLLHDIGNPPFGHFGEKVIKHWFEDNKDTFQNAIGIDEFSGKERKEEFEKFYEDLTSFDGNPQGFRIVSKLQWNHDENGLNLTASQLASLLKYDCSPGGKSADLPSKKKAGYFYMDQHVVEEVWRKLDMNEMRHPLSYLMEAADDLAYCMSDIEDGIEKGLIRGHEIHQSIEKSKSQTLKDIYKKISDEHESFNKNNDNKKLQDLQIFLRLKTNTTNALVEILSAKFAESINAITINSTKSLVESSPEASETLDTFRELAKRHLYNSRLVRENEIIANRVITGLLGKFKCLLDCSRSRFESIKNMESEDGNGRSISVEQSIYMQLASKYLKVYEKDLHDAKFIKDEDIREWLARAHLIIDHISGMTDKFALQKFRLTCAP